MKFTARFDQNDRRQFDVADGLVTTGFGWSIEFETDEYTDVAHSDEACVLVDGWLKGSPEEPAQTLLHRLDAALPNGWDDLDGEFVVIVVSRKRSEVRFLRDLVGVRPLFYFTGLGRATVASSVARVVNEPSVSRDIHEESLARHLAGLPAGPGRTLYQHVRTLPPGHAVSARGSVMTVSQVLTWNTVERFGLDLAEAASVSRSAVESALSVRSEQLPKAGFELSGGLDSSSLVGLAASMEVPGLLVGRIIFDDNNADERSYSDAVADYWDVDLHSSAPHEPDAERQAEYLRQLALPIPLPNGLMSRQLHTAFAEAGREIVVTGVGGDDAFAAMPAALRALDAVTHRDRQALAHFLRWGKRNPRRVWPVMIRPLLAEFTAFQRRRRRKAPWVSESAWRDHRLGVASADLNPRLGEFRAVDARWERFFNGRMAEIMERLALTEELGWLRTTHPYLDRAVVEATYGLHPNLTTAHGTDRSVQRLAFGDVLPSVVRTRTSKAEFSQTGWEVLHGSGGLERLTDGPLASSGLVDRDHIRARIDTAQERLGAVRPLAVLVNADAWLRWLGSAD